MIVLIRGGGDLASGVALRLHRAGLRVVITEIAQPLAVRRLVSFSEAIYSGSVSVEEVGARRVADASDTLNILQIFAKGQIPVLVDPQASSVKSLHPTVLVDARMLKRPAELLPTPVNLIIGLGPGFVVGENCHAVVETLRGHRLGRVYWQGSAAPDTGLPDPVRGQSGERVLARPRGWHPGSTPRDRAARGCPVKPWRRSPAWLSPRRLPVCCAACCTMV